MLMMKGDETEKTEGRKGIEEIIGKCGVVGGSAARVRKYLESGGAGGGGGGRKEHVPATAKGSAGAKATAKNQKSKKPKNDLTGLNDTLGGGGGKRKGRRKQ